MNAKEKAAELVDKAMGTVIFQIKQNIEAETITVSKCLAINTVNEMIEESIGYLSIDRNKYWKEVKKEICKL